MLAVEALGKRFGRREVFRGLSFELNRGDALVVLGRNGSGKSTLLKVIAGLLAPTTGKVRLPQGDIRTTVGLASLDLAMYSQLTVAEHFELAGGLRGCPARSEELAGKVGLSDRLNQPAGELSTGMRARLKLALAIQAEPMLLLLDEPGASMDAAGRELIEAVCAEQRSRGVLVVATNDPAERRLGSLELELAN